jgi:hypothetical protein
MVKSLKEYLKKEQATRIIDTFSLLRHLHYSSFRPLIKLQLLQFPRECRAEVKGT